EEDRITIDAAATTVAPRLDGSLDDPVWQASLPVAGFVQAEPDEGYEATEMTQVWVAYDDTHFYVAAVLHDSDPS
ncbi:MAG: hypothetical protein GWO24_07375, partial [Akkermansiaceae bacterium]|nr:hypothetical protein [Akkermansiaceae bacterium]